MSGQPRIVEVRQNILKENDVRAHALRERFERSGVCVVSLVSSPGAGKTALLEQTLAMLRDGVGNTGGFRAAALVGDLATERDAQRLARSGAPVKQITTGTLCHLEAAMVEQALQDWKLDELDFLFIENVGNLVCPSSFDLGESFRVVVVSVTEGEDKPLKYPTIFNGADAVVVSKADLAAAAEFERPAFVASVHAVRPGIPIMELSAKTGEGMREFLAFLVANLPVRTRRPDLAPISNLPD